MQGHIYTIHISLLIMFPCDFEHNYRFSAAECMFIDIVGLFHVAAKVFYVAESCSTCETGFAHVSL